MLMLKMKIMLMIALEELYENPDRLISDIEMNASIEDEDVL